MCQVLCYTHIILNLYKCLQYKLCPNFISEEDSSEKLTCPTQVVDGRRVAGLSFVIKTDR